MALGFELLVIPRRAAVAALRRALFCPVTRAAVDLPAFLRAVRRVAGRLVLMISSAYYFKCVVAFKPIKGEFRGASLHTILLRWWFM